ncbi:hypothetical protein POX_d05595 [Penicillium oxalicum]|uniref:Uncharacterized protein n=1 Tax=Penicillium oxalicum (strain 114-2 / CGMCC 5302) TaxID=933388 RepID=S7ZTZ8_PENO1|nr:hypothetical protein POX_d05595 [Penicillium oxalicum]EPS32241.1 hypothetical protein PDE_07201 [Penicillium oxalicum 114-2]KAI2790091.1 hypothetical protein POX_d05595 [Penicillium oxalicum]
MASFPSEKTHEASTAYLIQQAEEVDYHAGLQGKSVHRQVPSVPHLTTYSHSRDKPALISSEGFDEIPGLIFNSTC